MQTTPSSSASDAPSAAAQATSSPSRPARQMHRRKRAAFNCSNCRLRKVKCDRQRPVCGQCLRRDEGDTCQSGQDRAAPASLQHDGDSSSNGHGLIATVLDELRRVNSRLAALESSSNRSLDLSSPPSFTSSSSRSLPVFSPPVPAPVPSSGAASTRHQEAAEVLEDFGLGGEAPFNSSAHPADGWREWMMFQGVEEGLSREPATPAATPTSIADVLERLPPKHVAMQLVTLYRIRVYFLVGHVVHLPTLRRTIEALYATKVGVATSQPQPAETGFLALLFALFSLTLTLLPRHQDEELWPDVQAYANAATVAEWHRTALCCLDAALSRRPAASASVLSFIGDDASLIAVPRGLDRWALRAIVLLDQNEADADVRLARLRAALTSATQARLGVAPAASPLELEMDRRLWWALVVKDWSGGMAPCAYMVHPALFDVPLPKDCNDEDLEQGGDPRPTGMHTESSFPIAMARLAWVMREHADRYHRVDRLALDRSPGLSLEDTAVLEREYRDFLARMPDFYKEAPRHGEATIRGSPVLTQAWLLIQAVLHRLLQLNRAKIGGCASARQLCVDLAVDILTLQRRIRRRCSVVDVLWLNLAQSFSAALILCLDMINANLCRSARSVSGRDRETLLQLVDEALAASRFVVAVHGRMAVRMRRVLGVLVAEEQRTFASTAPCSPTEAEEAMRTIAAKAIAEVRAQPSRTVASRTDERPLYGRMDAGTVDPNGVSLPAAAPSAPLPAELAFALHHHLEGVGDSRDEGQANQAPAIMDEFWSWLLSQNLFESSPPPPAQ